MNKNQTKIKQKLNKNSAKTEKNRRKLKIVEKNEKIDKTK